MRTRVFVVLVGLALAAGCSSNQVRPGSKVNGKVTADGSPVSGAKVILVAGNASTIAGNSDSATTDETGKFVMVGVKPGTYKVVVYKLIPRKGAVLPPEGEGMDLEQIEASGMGSHALPKKYSQPSTTTLTATIGDGTSDVEVKADGK